MASRKIKKGFKEMHSRMEQQKNQQNSSAQQSTAPNTGNKPKAGDYIEFEEVKWSLQFKWSFLSIPAISANE